MSDDRSKEKQLTSDKAVPFLDSDWKVEVCDECLRACCWQGAFFCDDFQNAGTKSISISALKELDKESPHYWALDEMVLVKLRAKGVNVHD